MKVPHDNLDLLNLIGFPITRKKIKGVYSFGYHYVGASTHIRNRLIQHIHKYKNGDCSLNKNLKKYLDECFLSGEKPNVYFVSEDPFDEKEATQIINPSISPFAKFYHERYKR